MRYFAFMGLLLLLSACSQSGVDDHLGSEDDRPGDLEIRLVRSSESQPLLIGAVVTVAGREPRRLRNEEVARFIVLAPGEYEVEANELTPNCELLGDNPRPVTISPNETSNLILELACTFEPASRIVYQVEMQSGTGLSHDLHLVGSDGATQLKLTNDGRSNQAASFSADGTRIAWQRLGQLWVMNWDGCEATRLIDGRSELPTWSPDGETIAFQSTIGADPNDFAPRPDIWTVKVDGTNRV